MTNPPLRTPSFAPRCPNHNEILEGCGFPLPAKGVGTCPVSGAPFAFEIEVDDTKMVKNKDGTMSKAVGWALNGNENS